MKQVSANDIITRMEAMLDEEQRRHLLRFFKTGVGQYGEGDEFLGLKVPQTRAVVKDVSHLPLDDVPKLLTNRYHEIRLCGFLILVSKFDKLATKRLFDDAVAINGRDEIVQMYIDYADYANNWDLVDLSAPKLTGQWLMMPSCIDNKLDIMDNLAQSSNLWRQRISMVSTWMTSRLGDPSWCLRYAEMHLHHSHDLMHKAVGWMLREMGKQCDIDLLREFLGRHAYEMPRTMLRYSIEKMSGDEREYWMNQNKPIC